MSNIEKPTSLPEAGLMRCVMNSYYTELHGEGTEEHREITQLPPQRPARFARSDIEGKKLQVNMLQVAGYFGDIERSRLYMTSLATCRRSRPKCRGNL